MNKQINEISTQRLLSHFTDDKTLAIISTFRTERSEVENMTLLRKFKSDIRSKLKLGFTELKSRWVETNQDTNETISSDERSLIIYGISLEDAISFGQEYQQSSIIFKSKDKCAEVCTTSFIDFDGNEHNVGGIVRTFNIFNTNSPLNIQDAKDIFEKRKGGPASMPLKSNRAFKLSEMYEVESPSGKNFSNGKERFTRIF